MLRLLLILFLSVPLIEIYLLIQVGGILGALPTVGLIILTAILGAGLLRLQGLSTMQRVRQTMARGEVPAIEMLEGLVLLFCGALLLTPGFFTDIIGFLGLVPVLRRGLILWLLSKGLIQGRMDFSANIHGRASGQAPNRPESGEDDRQHKTIEGQFWHDDEKK